jgi:hypothetical protein
VDTDKFPLDEWVRAFQPHRRPDGTYLLSKADFFEKESFRYTGAIMVPFEPMVINEGKYTDEGLQELIALSIAPSCSKPEEEIVRFFDGFKKKFREKDGLIRMNAEGKREIAALINGSPSPMRRRELLYDDMLIRQLAAIELELRHGKRSTPEETAKVEMSAFSMLPMSRTEKAAKGLKSLEKRKESAPAAKGGGVEIKKIRKSRMGFRG